MKTLKKTRIALLAFTLLFLVGVDRGYAQNIRKGPYLILGVVNTEMQVLWQNDATSSDQVRWGTDLNLTNGPFTSAEYGTDHQHKYILSGLVAGTKYYYSVQVGASTYVGSFLVPPASETSGLKFFAYGDTRTYPATHNQVAQQVNATYLNDPECQTFIISMGDLVSSGYIEAPWEAEFFNYSYPDLMAMLRNLPYMSCIGNHEVSGSTTLFTKYFPYNFAGDRYYSFDYGPAHFTVVDQYVSYATGSPQYNWIAGDLAGTSKPWKFLYLHEPGWSAYGGHPNNTQVQTVLEPLCEQYNVSIVFAGHNHYYARASVPTASGSNIQHVTAGAAGAPLHTPDPSQPYIVSSAKSYNFCKIEIVDPYHLHFEARSNTGTLLDNFSIDRSVTTLNHYVPVSTTILQGTPNSGSYANLSTNNNSYFAVNSNTLKPRKCDWYGTFAIQEPPEEVVRFTITYDGKYSRSCNQSLYLYDFISASWTQIDSRSVSTKDVTITYVQNTPAKFISANGELRLRVYGTNTSKNFIGYGDFMELVVEAQSGTERIVTEEIDTEEVSFKETGSLSVYPNPAHTRLFVRFDLPEKSTVNLSVYNIMGSEVSSLLNSFPAEQGPHEISTNIGSLPPGMYLVALTAQTNGGRSLKYVQKLSVSR